VPGLGQDSTDLTLAGGESTTETLAVSTADGDAGEYTATVQSDDDSDTATVTVNESANFAVTISGTNSPVVEEDTLTVDATIENTGEASETQAVDLDIPGLGQNTTDVTLSGSESTTETLSVSTAAGDAGEYTATVASEDDSDSTTVTVNESANFSVTITETNSPVTVGQSLSVNTTVENTGEETATQSVNLTVPDLGNNSIDVTLAGGESTTRTLSISTASGDAGEYTATVQSDDDSDSMNVTVQEAPFFDVEITNTTSPVVEGDALKVNGTVTNTGETPDEQLIELQNVTGDTVQGVQMDLAGGESETFNLTWATTNGEVGDGEVSVFSENDTATAEVSIIEPALFNVSITQTNSPVSKGQTLKVNGTVENTGGVEGTQQIDLRDFSDSSVDTATVTLQGVESTTFNLTWDTDVAGEGEVAVSSADDVDTATVKIQQPAYFDVEITSWDQTVVEGETVAVDYRVENTGEVTATQDIEFTVDGATESIESDLTLTGGESFEGTFTYTTGESDSGTITVGIGSDNDSATREVTVEQRPEFESVDISDDSSIPFLIYSVEYIVDYQVEDPDGRFDRVEVTFENQDTGDNEVKKSSVIDGSLSYSETYFQFFDFDQYQITIRLYDEDGEVTDAKIMIVDLADGSDP
jgi:hypothetical protein